MKRLRIVQLGIPWSANHANTTIVLYSAVLCSYADTADTRDGFQRVLLCV